MCAMRVVVTLWCAHPKEQTMILNVPANLPFVKYKT
jgi:hypothetical protein